MGRFSTNQHFRFLLSFSLSPILCCHICISKPQSRTSEPELCPPHCQIKNLEDTRSRRHVTQTFKLRANIHQVTNLEIQTILYGLNPLLAMNPHIRFVHVYARMLIVEVQPAAGQPVGCGLVTRIVPLYYRVFPQILLSMIILLFVNKYCKSSHH